MQEDGLKDAAAWITQHTQKMKSNDRPQEINERVANSFKDLHQAREGEIEYKESTEKNQNTQTRASNDPITFQMQQVVL